MKTRKELKKLYNTLEFQKEYQYDGKDLGALCTQAGTTFHLWSPLAEEVELRLYRDGKHSECFQKIEEIIRAFEEIGSGGGIRHDFG